MSETLALEVATPMGLVLEEDVEAVEAPSVDGEFGVLPGHLPLLAALRSGILKFHVDGKVHVAAIGPGFAEAEPDRVKVLTDAFATADAIDVTAVRAELEEAEKRLTAFGELHEGKAYDELQRAIDWAAARIEAATHEHG